VERDDPRHGVSAQGRASDLVELGVEQLVERRIRRRAGVRRILHQLTARSPASGHVDGVPSTQLWHDVAEEAFVDYRTGRLTFEAQRRQRVSRFLPLVGVDTTGMDDAWLDAEFDKYLHRYEAAWQAIPTSRRHWPGSASRCGSPS
jgi:hypothetical protein